MTKQACCVIVGYYLLTYGYGQEHFRHVESYLVLSEKAKKVSVFGSAV
jgi:hypothetical protein